MRRVTFSYTNWKWKSIHFEISLYLQKSEPEKSYDPSKYHIHKELFTIYKTEPEKSYDPSKYHIHKELFTIYNIRAPNNFFAILNALLLMYHCWGFPGGSEGKASACNEGDLGSIPGSRRSPGEGNGNPLQYSCLENPMGRGAWRATVHGVAKSRTRLSN